MDLAEQPAQVIVVDGGSFDGCGEMLGAEFPDVTFVQAQENIGFGCSNNLGFKLVAGDLVLLLNPDAELRPGAVKTMVREFLALPDVGVLGPKLLNTDGSLQTSCVQALPNPVNQAIDCEFLRRLFPNWRYWGVSEAFSSSIPVQVEAISGACMLLRSEVFRRVGGFNPAFFMYGEDMDLCAKIRKLGLAVFHVPGAEVVHHGGGSSRTQFSDFSIVQMRVAIETFMLLNHGPAAAFAYRTMQGISGMVRSLLLFPIVLWPGSHQVAARSSLKKWLAVLKWAFNVERRNGHRGAVS